MNSNKHIEQVQALNLAFAVTEQKLAAEIRSLRQREEQVAAQVQALHQQAKQKEAEQAHALNQQLTIGQQELHRLEQERVLLEKDHAEQARKDRQEREVLLRTQARRELEVAAQLLATQQRAAQDKAELSHSNGEQERALQRQHAARENALTQHLQAGQEELHRLQQAQVKREQAVAEKLEAIQIRAAQENVELARTLTEQQHALHSQHLARVHTLAQQLEAEKQERIKREQILLEQTSQARQEIENLLRAQAQREREVLAQSLIVQQQIARDKVDMARAHLEDVREFSAQKAWHEQAFTQQLHAHQHELRNLQKDCVKREQEAEQEKADLIRQHSKDEHALLLQQADREKTHSLQLENQHEAHCNLQCEQLKREKILLDQTSQLVKQLQELQSLLEEQEQETLEQLLNLKQQARQETAELTQKFNEQLNSLRSQLLESEKAFIEKINIREDEIQSLYKKISSDANQYEDRVKILSLEKIHQSKIFARKENDLISNLTTAEDANKEQQQRQDESSIEYNLQLNAHVEEIERLNQIIFDENNKIISGKQGFWRNKFSPLKIAHYSAVDKDSFTRPSTPTSKMAPKHTGAPMHMQPVKQINYQPQFKTKPNGDYQLDDFQSLYDKTFVRSAYLAILKREPDEDGAEYYLHRIRTGASKSTVLNQIRKSHEAKKYKTSISGLSTAIFLETICNVAFLGNIFSAIIFLSNIKTHLQDLRAFENHIIRMAEETQDLHQSNIETLLNKSNTTTS